MGIKRSFVMYASWSPLFRTLPKEQAGELIKAIYAYQDGEDPTLTDSAVASVFELIKATMEQDRQKYAEVCAKRAEAAKQKHAIASNSMQMQANACKRVQTGYDTESDTESDSDKDIKKEKRKSIFVRPSVEEVRAYCNERNNSVDPQTFVDFYAAKGWKVGSASMKDWKACVRTWEKREQPKPKKQSFGNQRNYDFAELEKKLLQG